MRNAKLSAAGSNRSLQYFAVVRSIQSDLRPSQHGIEGKGLDGKNEPLRSHQLGKQHRLEAMMRANVQHSIAWSEYPRRLSRLGHSPMALWVVPLDADWIANPKLKRHADKRNFLDERLECSALAA